MIEVHSGTRPGKPLRLKITCGLALAGSLGLAWYQTTLVRAFDSSRRIPGTPLVVQPPRGWTRSTLDPALYYIPEDRKIPGQPSIERSVRFLYRKIREFRSPQELLEAQNWLIPGQAPTPTTVAGIPGLQVVREELVSDGYTRYRRRIVRRIACSQQGDIVGVEYKPLTELTAGDIEFLDDICNRMQLTELKTG